MVTGLRLTPNVTSVFLESIINCAVQLLSPQCLPDSTLVRVRRKPRAGYSTPLLLSLVRRRLLGDSFFNGFLRSPLHPTTRRRRGLRVWLVDVWTHRCLRWDRPSSFVPLSLSDEVVVIVIIVSNGVVIDGRIVMARTRYNVSKLSMKMAKAQNNPIHLDSSTTVLRHTRKLVKERSCQVSRYNCSHCVASKPFASAKVVDGTPGNAFSSPPSFISTARFSIVAIPSLR